MYIYIHICTYIYLRAWPRAGPWALGRCPLVPGPCPARAAAQGPGPGPGPGPEVYVCTYMYVYVHVYMYMYMYMYMGESQMHPLQCLLTNECNTGSDDIQDWMWWGGY